MEGMALEGLLMLAFTIWTPVTLSSVIVKVGWRSKLAWIKNECFFAILTFELNEALVFSYWVLHWFSFSSIS
jgi:hypothetical protein